jgi:ribosome biogenesis protein Nip4
VRQQQKKPYLYALHVIRKILFLRTTEPENKFIWVLSTSCKNHSPLGWGVRLQKGKPFLLAILQEKYSEESFGYKSSNYASF